jgi:putative DNA modification/repair radical SAM protein
MDIEEKLKILTGAAKYDVACTSSGSAFGQKGKARQRVCLGHMPQFFVRRQVHLAAEDFNEQRLLVRLQLLRQQALKRHAKGYAFAPRACGADDSVLQKELYRRAFPELRSTAKPDYTCEQMIAAIRLLREEYAFNGYIHAKAIPGTDENLIAELGLLVDRMSVNIELPSSRSLQLLAPNKTKEHILKPMRQIREGIRENKTDLALYKKTPRFVPGGQATQLIVGASPETDLKIITLSESLYDRFKLKRVFYSAYIPVVEGKNLPSVNTKPPLLREHRLYQADFLLRFYGFAARELLSEKTPDFNTAIDPKCNWALNNMDFFPVEVNRAPLEALLRVPVSALRVQIVSLRRAKPPNWILRALKS